MAGEPWVEWTCQDCGHAVISFEPWGTTPTLCGTCDWIRKNIPREQRPAVRERLGVPLREAGDGG